MWNLVFPTLSVHTNSINLYHETIRVFTWSDRSAATIISFCLKESCLTNGLKRYAKKVRSVDALSLTPSGTQRETVWQHLVGDVSLHETSEEIFTKCIMEHRRNSNTVRSENQDQ